MLEIIRPYRFKKIVRKVDNRGNFVDLNHSDKRASFVFAGEKEEELFDLKEMIEEGKIKSIVDKIYSFGQAAEAHRRVETEQRLGTVVISMEHNNKT